MLSLLSVFVSFLEHKLSLLFSLSVPSSPLPERLSLTAMIWTMCLIKRNSFIIKLTLDPYLAFYCLICDYFNACRFRSHMISDFTINMKECV